MSPAAAFCCWCGGKVAGDKCARILSVQRDGNGNGSKFETRMPRIAAPRLLSFPWISALPFDWTPPDQREITNQKRDRRPVAPFATSDGYSFNCLPVRGKIADVQSSSAPFDLDDSCHDAAFQLADRASASRCRPDNRATARRGEISGIAFVSPAYPRTSLSRPAR